ncbi:hypothetical protein JG687_00004015 [Phytophthora cactorum]|uniref:Uncharacterized protein n=1 Tax=Phytophthora cactorum TaxID=29920 RepID=A0A8T1USF9_9STRA|nr:hypothetical protein JG687_00004015 [Phytophthora cactorum]
MISVMTATIKISLWAQLWKFLRAHKKEKLCILTLPSVHLLVVKSAAELAKTPQRREGSASPPFWQSLDTCIGLKDIQHPIWNGVRAWFPRLMFLFRSVHTIEVGVGSVSVDIIQKDGDAVTPMLSIKHGSVFVNAAFDAKTNELSCTVTLSRTESMQVIVQGLNATAALGHTEVNIRVPIYHNHEESHAPIPSAYSVIIDLIRVNLDLEHTLQAALRLQCCGEPSEVSYTTADSNTIEGLCLRQVLTVLRLAEIIPDDFRCEIRKSEVIAVDKVSTRNPGSLCTLELNGFSVSLSGDSIDNQDLGTMNKINSDYPVVSRTADLALGLLTVRLNEADDSKVVSPMVKLHGLKLDAEGTLFADVANESISDEVEENVTEQPSLFFRSTISGGCRGLNIVISKSLEPWMASCCAVYDNTVKVQGRSPPMQPLIEKTCQIEEFSAMEYCEIELDAHFKLLKTEVTLLSLDQTCDVLPKGVPSISLVLGEISVYAHPFVNEDHLGVRAKADIQCSRLKASYFSSNELVKCPFLSLDFVRVFIFPVETMMQSEVPAEVEMEADVTQDSISPGEVIAFRASGDKLHRLHATNLSVTAKLCDEVDVRLTVGVFAGDDLPEVWLFEDISIKVNAFEMAAVGCVRVRHTLASQKDYIFGEFEDMLRKRLLACKRSTSVFDQTLADGILVEISKLHLRSSRDFPLQSYADSIQSSFAPFKDQATWRCLLQGDGNAFDREKCTVVHPESEEAGA